MTIYVDPLRHWGWILRGHQVKSCHLFTESLDLSELHAFAALLGMKRAWFQHPPVAPHYDLTERRRLHAVSLGAVEVGRREAGLIWQARRAMLVSVKSEQT
ncbi:DUF4031 domain-containing protein [Ralstonia holmesii]|uniref:DUF4031 domain-containing protein n=1 Tax=Ralstonia TaxID=48736 RepID=UPI000469F674|nr:DUF4031 domain-containing protein [Ralstonia pickettii]KMW47574.1 hypothetical protein AC240_08460 [Ralstonia sp. MD27]MBA9869631.1 DUF4031 domain-containing protein [Ralstonia insidiosa]MBA9884392.1 DUF4031 domain-containing protein [Ralstonia pickettii]MBA9894120.1 DUF4031 domain-containing protein [Ralstonia pickettii]MBA9913660.1 DUF4031 domain-containing protein [Ralstonia insidiosa]